MIIFLYGSDSYYRQKKLNKILEEYRHKYSNLSCDYFDLENSDELSRLKEFAAQMLIFDNKKLAVLKNTYEADEEKLKEFLRQYLNSEDFTILISEENSPSAELKFLLKKSFLTEDFKEPKGENQQFFIQREAKERKLSLTSAAINFLANAFTGDSWGLINELDKLVLFSKNSSIDAKDLKQIGDYQYQSPNIFGFINAVIENWPPSQKIIMLEKLFVGQEEPVKIFNILASLRRLPNKLIQKLAGYDVMIKSGKLDYEEALLDLAIG